MLRSIFNSVGFIFLAICACGPVHGQISSDTDATATFDAAHASFDAIHARIASLANAKASRDSTEDLVATWLAAQNINQLSVEQSRWSLEQILPQKTERNAFSVTWTGSITAPITGAYVFSVSPINVNKSLPGEELEHAITVSISGNQVLAVGHSDWPWQGKQIQLQAGQPAALKVDMNFSAQIPTYGDSPHAILYWQGPGISRQVVPSDVLSPPEGKGRGLRADYHWTENGQPQQATLLDHNIEFAWATCRDVSPRYPELVQSLTDHLWQASTDPGYLASLISLPPPSHPHVFFRNYTSTEFLSMSRRREFAQILVQNPDVLRMVDQNQMIRLFAVLRFGDAQAAVNMLGTWMQQNPNKASRVSQQLFQEDRRFNRTLGLYLVCRASDPNEYQLLEQFLQMPDGRCCLPVAYTLAECNGILRSDYYPTKGRVDDWIVRLDQILADPSLTGEKRINWLLARAYAEEIRSGPPGRGAWRMPELAFGDGWLKEALIVAETGSSRTRVEQELVARMVARGNVDQASHEIDALASNPDADLAQRLADWRNIIEIAIADEKQREISERNAVQGFYRARLIARRDEAEQLGDADAVGQFDNLIQALPASN